MHAFGGAQRMRHKTRNKPNKSNTCQRQVDYFSGCIEISLAINYCHKAMGTHRDVVHIHSAPAFSLLQSS